MQPPSEDEIKKFTCGTVVYLKSGGPPMTVRAYVDQQASQHTGYHIGVWCEWIDSFGAPREGTYYSDQLKIVAPPDIEPPR